MEVSQVFKDFKGRNGGKLKEEWEGGRGGGHKRGGLTDVSCYLQTPRCYRTLSWASGEGRTGTRPYQKSDQNQNFNSLPTGGNQNPTLSSG